jgi:ribosomal protein S20
MPIGKSAKKSLRKSIANRKANLTTKLKLKQIVRKFLKKPSNESLGEAYSALDKAKKTRLINRKKVARIKSNLSKKMNGVAKTEVKKAKVKKKAATKNE